MSSGVKPRSQQQMDALDVVSLARAALPLRFLRMLLFRLLYCRVFFSVLDELVMESMGGL